MFSDPSVAVMAMIFLCFAGMIVMFVFVARSLSSQGEETREALRKQQMYLADLERQMMELSFLLRQSQEGENTRPGGGTRSSAVKESPVSGDADLMSMLDAATRKNPGQPLDLEDALLPPPSVARPLAEEYDPAKDPHLFEDSLLSSSPRTRSEGRVGTVGGKGRAPLSLRLDD